MSKPFAWSYSVLNSFETCPRRHYLTRVSKEVSEEQSDAMAWGNRVHRALELRLKGVEALPHELASYEPLVASVQAAAANGGVIGAEKKLACDASYQPTAYFAPNVWVRGITDFDVEKPHGRVAFVGDWKTGKPTPASAQLRLTAAMTFSHKPHIDRVITAFVWLADGSTTREEFTRDQAPAIWAEFHPRVTRLEQALQTNRFPANPSGLCRKWCPVPKRLCEHSGRD